MQGHQTVQEWNECLEFQKQRNFEGQTRRMNFLNGEKFMVNEDMT